MCVGGKLQFTRASFASLWQCLGDPKVTESRLSSRSVSVLIMIHNRMAIAKENRIYVYYLNESEDLSLAREFVSSCSPPLPTPPPPPLVSVCAAVLALLPAPTPERFPATITAFVTTDDPELLLVATEDEEGDCTKGLPAIAASGGWVQLRDHR